MQAHKIYARSFAPIKKIQFQTPLGDMIAVADDFGLYRLDFVDNPDLPKAVNRLEKTIGSTIIAGETSILFAVQQELRDYFDGRLTTFAVSLMPQGTAFQKRVWMALTKVPYGTTQSYADIAAAIEQPTAFRAVANANGENPIAIITPCHRIIKSSGDLCGYRSGIERKRWLLAYERKYREIPL